VGISDRIVHWRLGAKTVCVRVRCAARSFLDGVLVPVSGLLMCVDRGGADRRSDAVCGP
jgi:hypothetical protein